MNFYISKCLMDDDIRYASVAFKSRDPNGTGFISSSDFEDILLSIKWAFAWENMGDDPFAIAGLICWRTLSKPTWGQRQEAKG